MANAVSFEKYLASRRTPLEFRYTNPYADVLEKDLRLHLDTVRRWINGKVDTVRMREAMEFVGRQFPGEFRPTKGKYVYRGQAAHAFDGEPRSYTYERDIAEYFAYTHAAWLTHKQLLLVRREVCFNCPDSGAFKIGLDLGKLLKAYAGHMYAAEKEVILLNTEPKGDTKVWEMA